MLDASGSGSDSDVIRGIEAGAIFINGMVAADAFSALMKTLLAGVALLDVNVAPMAIRVPFTSSSYSSSVSSSRLVRR